MQIHDELNSITANIILAAKKIVSLIENLVTARLRLNPMVFKNVTRRFTRTYHRCRFFLAWGKYFADQLHLFFIRTKIVN